MLAPSEVVCVLNARLHHGCIILLSMQQDLRGPCFKIMRRGAVCWSLDSPPCLGVKDVELPRDSLVRWNHVLLTRLLFWPVAGVVVRKVYG